MYYIKILAISAIGFFLGLGLWYVITSGYLQPWEKLPTPPQEVTELISTVGGDVFIKTNNGATYFYSGWRDEGWIETAISQDESPMPTEITDPCNFSSPEFFVLANPPDNIADCIQVQFMYGDGYILSTYVLDNNGDVWHWSHSVTGDSVLQMICFPFVGLLMGMCIAFLGRSVLSLLPDDND